MQMTHFSRFQSPRCGNSSSVDGTSTRNPIFRYPESSEKWVEGKLNKAILHFLPYFLPYLMIFHGGALQDFIKYDENLAEKKTCSPCLQPIFRMIPGTRKSDFGTCSATINFKRLHSALKSAKKCKLRIIVLFIIHHFSLRLKFILRLL